MAFDIGGIVKYHISIIRESMRTIKIERPIVNLTNNLIAQSQNERVFHKTGRLTTYIKSTLRDSEESRVFDPFTVHRQTARPGQES